MRVSMEPLFYQAGVDVVFYGHGNIPFLLVFKQEDRLLCTFQTIISCLSLRLMARYDQLFWSFWSTQEVCHGLSYIIWLRHSALQWSVRSPRTGGHSMFNMYMSHPACCNYRIIRSRCANSPFAVQSMHMSDPIRWDSNARLVHCCNDGSKVRKQIVTPICHWLHDRLWLTSKSRICHGACERAVWAVESHSLDSKQGMIVQVFNYMLNQCGTNHITIGDAGNTGESSCLSIQIRAFQYLHLPTSGPFLGFYMLKKLANLPLLQFGPGHNRKTPYNAFPMLSYWALAEGLSFLNSAKTGLSFEDYGTGCSNVTTAGSRVSYLNPINGQVSDPWAYYARALTFQVEPKWLTSCEYNNKL